MMNKFKIGFFALTALPFFTLYSCFKLDEQVF